MVEISVQLSELFGTLDYTEHTEHDVAYQLARSCHAIKVDPDPDCPRNRKQAMEGPHRKEWYEAERIEYDSHINLDIWKLRKYEA